MTGFNEGLNTIATWIVRLVVLNLCGLLATLTGLVIFGFFPALASMYAVTRRWILKLDEEESFFKYFWYTYKSNFLKTNLIGWILLGAAFILYIDFQFLQGLTGFFYVLMVFILFTLAFLFLTVSLYTFPVYVHYDIKLLQTFKYALVIGISFPFVTISMLVILLTVSMASALYTAMLPFFSFSLFVYGIMSCALYTFNKIEKKAASA